MNGKIELRMDTFSVFGLSEDADADAVRGALDGALQKLATRLARSPFARSGVKELAIERLSLGTLSADELLSERGAERLADELYSVLEGRLR